MKINKTIIAIAVAITALAASAQNSVTSPYSRYGYGLLNDNVTSTQRAMGSVGYAMNSGRQINVMNPASYAAIDTLTFLFDIGGNVRNNWSTETQADGKHVSGTNFGGGLDYITMQFPLGKYMGGSAGLLPFSEVGYSFGETIERGHSSREGSGGINEVYVGVAGRPYKGLSVGANIGYLFGTILNDTYATNTLGSKSLYERVLKVTDYKLEFGVQYSYKFNKVNKLTAGVTYAPGKSFHGHTYGVNYLIGDNTQEPDTTGYTTLKGKYSMPATWGAGINYQWNECFMAEVDFTYQPWAHAKYQNIENYEFEKSFADRYRVNLGLQYMPHQRGAYLKRVQYRAGAFYNRDYMVVKGNNVREYGVTLGFGLPTSNTAMLRSVVNIAFEYKRRAAYPTNLIKEDYFTVTLGVNFNEMWFFQNKIH